MATMPPQLWTYRARLERVVDGDTIDVTLDCGLHNYRTERLRLLGVNAPEVHGPTKAAGDAATAFTVDWLRQGVALDPWSLIVQTHKSDDFGRYLARVWRVSDGALLNDALLAAGQAIPYMVGTP